MTVPDTRLTTDALLTHLATTGLEVGDAVAPANSDRPYLVLYRIGDFDIDGPLSGASEDAIPQYQVTSVGDTREQAEWAQTKARTAMTGSDPTSPVGYKVFRPRLTPGPGTTRDDGWDPPLFYAVDTYQFNTTPA